MDETNLDDSGVLETTEAEGETEQITPEELAVLREKAAKADDLDEKNKQLFERAKKAEQKQPEVDGLSPKDALLLAKANVDLEDVDEVVDYAKFKKLTIADALNQSVLKTILNERKEVRATEAATATGRGNRGGVAETDASIIAQASRGQLPTDEAGIAKLADARMNNRLKK